MKDTADKSTLESIENPKKRGRPASQNPKTDAERQAIYRENKLKRSKESPFGQRNLNIWVKGECKWDLEYLARHYEISPAKMIEKLVKEAQEKQMKTMKTNSEEYNHYFRDI